MARKRREWNPHMFDHIIMRGNNRQNIFKHDADVHAFFRILQYTYEKTMEDYCKYCAEEIVEAE